MSDLDAKDATGQLTDSFMPTPSPKPENNDSSSTGHAKDHKEMMKELSALNRDINHMVTVVVMEPVTNLFSTATSGLSSMLSDSLTGSPDEHQKNLSGFDDKSQQNNQAVDAVKKVVTTVAENPEVLALL